MLEIEVVPDLIDMTKWKLVIVRLEYADPDNKLTLDRTLKLTGVPLTPEELRWTVPIKDATKRTFTYRIQAFGHDGSKHVPDPVETTDPLVLLEF